MYRFIIALSAFLWVGTTHAGIINDFTGPYSASNWSAGGVGGITVNNSDPEKLIFNVTGSTPRIQDFSTFTYQTVVAESGAISFDWAISSFFLNSPAPSFRILFDGFPIPPADTSLVTGPIDGPTDVLGLSTGHAELSVTAGQTFRFIVSGFAYAPQDSTEFVITNFSAPVTEPSVLLLFGLGLIGLATQRRKA